MEEGGAFRRSFEEEEEEEEEEEGLYLRIETRKEEFNQRCQEARPTRCRVEPARVSSPKVDLTCCGLDKTPTVLA